MMNYNDSELMIECVDKMLALTVFFYVSKKALGLYDNSNNSEHDIEGFVRSCVNVDASMSRKLVDITLKYSRISQHLQQLFLGNYPDANISADYQLTSREEHFFRDAISGEFNVSTFEQLSIAISLSRDLAKQLFELCESAVMRLISELYHHLIGSCYQINTEYMLYKIFYNFDRSFRNQLATSISYKELTSDLCLDISELAVSFADV
jgi:hypothetical protein